MSHQRRLLTVIVLAPVLVALVAWARPSSKAGGVPRARFWVEKAHWPAAYDVVVAGDSRTYRGVAPSAMQDALPSRRIANFGFSGAGFDRIFLDAAAARLDPGAPTRTLVLGITPFSVTPRAARRSGYTRQAGMDPLRIASRVYLGPILQLLRPVKPAELRDAVAHPEWGYYEHYYPDGWVSARVVPEDPTAALEKYRDVFPGNQADDAMIAELMAWVTERRSEGIDVFAFRPPSTLAMVALEEEQSGFDEADFARRLDEAGGRWLPFDSVYPSYDGSHLREDGALAFSADLAEAIRENPVPPRATP